MSKTAEKTGTVELSPAGLDEQPILANLLELYAHDFSEFHDIELRPDGRFGYEPLPLYWLEPDRHPFLIRVDGNLAGFALVKHGSEVSGRESIWDMAEFFVTRHYRRLGIGTAIAHALWRRFPGLWEIRVMESNEAALPFWEHAVSSFVGKPITPVRVEKPGKRWSVLAFESTASPA